MILTVHNCELVRSRYQAEQLCLIRPSLKLTSTAEAVSEEEEEEEEEEQDQMEGVSGGTKS